MKYLILLLALASLAAYAERVAYVQDGDTLTLANKKKVRLFGVDAPELDQPYGQESKNYLAALVLGRDVDLLCIDKSYKRLVCLIDINGMSVQRELVGRGLAYDEPHFSKSFYASSEDFAKRMERGVWALPNGGVRPWVFRHRKK